MSSFAKAQLLKYGWTEGKGLGKNENGIVDAIRPKLKFDSKGIGHSDKEYKWWESVYDKASGNIKIDVSNKSENITIGIKETDAVKITTKKIHSNELAKNLQYGNFLKTCTLDGGKIVAAENSENLGTRDTDVQGATAELTDEQLFQACGGRTAHKGARHGLKLNGKLARIARQEAELLGNSVDEAASVEWTEVERKRSRRKRKRRRSGSAIDEHMTVEQCKDANANNVEDFSPPIVVSDSEIRKKSKKSRRKEKRRFQELASKLSDVSIIEDESKPEMAEKRSKYSNVGSEDVHEIPIVDIENDSDTVERSRGQKSSSEAERLNYRIDKKKRKALEKSAKKRVEKMSDCLMAVNLNEDSEDSGNPTSHIYEGTKKMKKRKRNKKMEKSKKIIPIIELEG